MMEELFNENFKRESDIDSEDEHNLCTLRTLDGKSFQCHKNILYSSSSFFRGLLESTRSDTNSETIELNENVDSEALELILEYISKGSIQNPKLSADLLIKLYLTADFLIVNGLTNLIENFYLIESLSIDTCLTLWRTDSNQLTKKFREESIEFIKINCVKFLKSHLLELNLEEINFLLSSENLQCSQEILLSNILKWIKADLPEREKYIKDFVKRIKIEEISKDFITKNILEDEILCENVLLIQTIIKEMQENNVAWVVNVNTKNERNPVLITQNSFIEINMDKRRIIKLFDWNKKKNRGFSVAKYKDNTFIFSEWDSCEYNSNNNKFHALPSLLEKRYYHASINFNNNIYCCGGNVKNRHNGTIEVFDLNHMKWLRKPTMNYSRICFGLIEFEGQLYAIGGNKAKSNSGMEAFDARMDKWLSVLIKNDREDLQEFWTRAVVDNKNRMFVSHINEVFQIKMTSRYAEIVKTFNIESFNNFSYPVPFTYKEDLYLYCRDINNKHSNWLRLNEYREQFEPVHFYGNKWDIDCGFIL